MEDQDITLRRRFNSSSQGGKPIYTKRLSQDGREARNFIHLHLDLHDCPSALVESFLQIGFEADDFHPESGVYGCDGDPQKRYPVSAPRAHFTFKPHAASHEGKIDFRASIEDLAAMEAMAKHLINAGGVRGYTETELIIMDRQYPYKPFSETSFRKYFPKYFPSGVDAVSDRYEKHVFYNDLGRGEIISLPVIAHMRSLGDDKKTAKEMFRKGELHLVMRRQGTDPRILTALAAMSPSTPSIFKRIQNSDGSFEKDRSGNDAIIEDVAYTFQSDDMNTVYKMAAMLHRIISDVGGCQGASLKIEPVIGYSLHNGVQPESRHGDLPMIVHELDIRPGTELDIVSRRYRDFIDSDVRGFPMKELSRARDRYENFIGNLPSDADVEKAVQAYKAQTLQKIYLPRSTGSNADVFSADVSVF